MQSAPAPRRGRARPLRDLYFENLGYEMLRFTYWEIATEVRRVASEIRARLASRRQSD